MSLRLNNVSKRFGGILALNDVNVEVKRNTILGIIGPNGSGKTTLLNVISGIYTPDEGEVIYNGRIITGLSPSRIARLGIARTFQITKVFGSLTVLQNLLVAHHRGRGDKVERALSILESTNLIHVKDKLARELSGGQQKLLEFARALMMDPELMLLDEPLAGVFPELKEFLITLLMDLHKRGKTIILVTHDIPSIMLVCKEIVVLNSGRKIAEGTPEEISRDVQVIEAYLGE